MTDPERTREYRPPQRPSNNDVIKIDGRFAEVYSISDDGMDFRYLDTPSEVGTVKWENVELVRVEDALLDTSEEVYEIPTAEGNYQNRLGRQARFYGEYKKIKIM